MAQRWAFVCVNVNLESSCVLVRILQRAENYVQTAGGRQTGQVPSTSSKLLTLKAKSVLGYRVIGKRRTASWNGSFTRVSTSVESRYGPGPPCDASYDFSEVFSWYNSSLEVDPWGTTALG